MPCIMDYNITVFILLDCIFRFRFRLYQTVILYDENYVENHGFIQMIVLYCTELKLFKIQEITIILNGGKVCEFKKGLLNTVKL